MSDDTDGSLPRPHAGESAEFSRRGLFRGAAIIIGGAAVLVGASSPAQAKMTQAAAAYQDKPKGDAICASCSFFRTPSACLLVDGTISPNGWCKFYSKKS